ncbi:MBL fold metallo-hydrolase [Candidatus Micrarchaeota archaeon]|nr:MBL fold metallo-hydrolase [Candidatus Micrarchaeota archaeon]
MIEVFRGKAKDPKDALRATLATGYLIGKFAVDSPEGVAYPGNPLILITHAHCDHVCGLNTHNLDYACSGFCAKAIEGSIESALLCSHLGLSPPRRPPREVLSEGQVLESEGFSIEVIETPGHAEGALCFYIREHKALFSGDTVFGEGFLPSLSLPTSSKEALLESYEKLSNYEIRKIYPGHGSPFEAEGYIRSLIPIAKEFI